MDIGYLLIVAMRLTSWQIKLQREVLKTAVQPDSISRYRVASALRTKTIEKWTKSHKHAPSKIFNILWRDKLVKELIKMSRRDL